MKIIMALMAAISLSATSALAAERRWMRSEILGVADAEAVRRGYAPEEIPVSLSSSEMGNFIDAPNSCLKAANGRRFWIAHYVPLKPHATLKELWVCVDRETGSVLHIAEGE